MIATDPPPPPDSVITPGGTNPRGNGADHDGYGDQRVLVGVAWITGADRLRDGSYRPAPLASACRPSFSGKDPQR